MPHSVRFSKRAHRDIDETLLWFKTQHSTKAGEDWFHQLKARIETLEVHPERCAIADISDQVGVDVRELLFGSRRAAYRILFTIQGSFVDILHVRHCARGAFGSDDLVTE